MTDARHQRRGPPSSFWDLVRAYAPLAPAVASAFDPTLTNRLDQLRLEIRTFIVYSAEHPELLGLMNIEARQDTERLAYIFNTYIAPSLEPLARLVAHLAEQRTIRKVPLRALFFLISHGAAAPFTHAPLARLVDPTDPTDPAAIEAHARLTVDLIVRAPAQ
ncbi:MAG: hypothetical protein JOZ69_21125 [Myxococcales bacterium]|nr:hypothetical protein [Myxococcales bacterium]